QTGHTTIHTHTKENLEKERLQGNNRKLDCSCRTEDASCCLQTTQTSTEIYSSWFTEGFVFEGLTCLTCEAGWEPHGGNCYYFSTSKSSWTDSRRSCTDLGSDLVKIDSREDIMILHLKNFWIGLTDSKEEGKWLWVDGSPLNKSFWMPWEPDNTNITNPGGEDCGGMGKKGGADDLMCWFDQLCGLRRRSICEKPADLPNHSRESFVSLAPRMK
uniref:C-type lectin domain-containing protein n=1 Tax=Poecilia mexicana TaxID=48701 RepID=A0A3B3WBW2_9TELE